MTVLSLVLCLLPHLRAEDAPPPAPATPATPVAPADAVPAEPPAVDEAALFGGDPDEAAMFGDPAAAEVPVAGAGTTDFGDISVTRTSDADITAKLASYDERLTIGGKLFLRASAATAEDVSFADSTFGSANLLDLYADARPNDRVRGFAAARLNYDFTVAEGDTDDFGTALSPASVVLDQLWLKFDLARAVYVTTGRQRIKWGSGRFWNPTDFMNQQTLDALSVAVFDERTGVGLLKVHVPIESLGANLYAVGNFDGADTFEQIGGALRTEWVLGPSEIALSAAAREGDPVRLGADASAGVGPFDVHAEAAFRHGDTTPTYTGDYDLATFTEPAAVSHEDEWIVEVVGGAEVSIRYNDEDSVAIGAEYFYNSIGYEDATLYPYLAFVGAFTPFYLGKHYAAGYVYLGGPGNWDEGAFTLSTLANLSDQSLVSRLDVSGTINTQLRVNVYSQVHYGEQGEFRFGVDIDPVPGILPDGFTVPTPLVDFGVGAQITF